MTTSIFKVRISSNDGSIFLWRQEIPVLSNNDVWRDAIELEPRPVVTSRQLLVPQYDLSATPIGITYTVIDASIAERKDIALTVVRNDYTRRVNELVQASFNNSSDVNADTINQIKLDCEDRNTAILAATTHEELDTILGL